MLLAPAFWLLLTAPLLNQSAPSFWSDTPAATQRKLGPPRIRPTHYRAVTLDLPAARQQLAQVPAEGPAPALFSVPLPDGSQRAFRVQRSAVMSPALAAKFPEIQSFEGRDVADPAASARLDLSPAGLRVQLIGYGGTFFIEPYRTGDSTHYLSFDKAALPAGSKQWHETPPKR